MYQLQAVRDVVKWERPAWSIAINRPCVRAHCVCFLFFYPSEQKYLNCKWGLFTAQILHHMFKSCGKIIFWQKLCSLRQAMPWCVSFRRDGFQRDFPYGASNQSTDSFWTCYWDVNQGSEGYTACKWSCWWELTAPHRGGAPTAPTLVLTAVFQT